jgi:hypothetical protein
MHPLVRGAAAAAVFTALGSFDRPAPAPAPSATPQAEVHGVFGLPAPCLSGTLPEGPVCLRIPREDEAPVLLEGRAPVPSRGDPIAERIPRRPERPADPAAYVYPVGELGRPPRVLGGLDRPVTMGAPAPNPSGVRLAVRLGERVVVLALDHQVGPAEVIFIGDLFGRTVVTAHTVTMGGDPPNPPARPVDAGPRQRTYLLFHGGLDRVAPGVVPGARLEAGAELGFARASPPPALGAGLIDVYVEAREVRDGAKVDAAGADNARHLVDPAVGVPIDVRNVLPLRQP